MRKMTRMLNLFALCCIATFLISLGVATNSYSDDVMISPYKIIMNAQIDDLSSNPAPGSGDVVPDGPAPNSGDGDSDGSGMKDRSPNGNPDSENPGPAPKSGDGVPDGSGF